jgi:hypothetical protein
VDPIELLAREDRWQLSAGEGLVFAPPHPLWLDTPGFWDDASIVGAVFGPLFTITVLDDDGLEIPAHLTSRRWSPAELAAEYRLANGATATEVRTVQPGGVLASEWRIEAPRPTRLNLVVWTAQPGDLLDGPMRYDGTVVFRRRPRGKGRPCEIAMACVGGVTSWALARSESTPLHPRWDYAPFSALWTTDGLAPGHASVEPAEVTYAAVHRALHVGSEGTSALFAMRMASGDLPSATVPPSASPTAVHAATLGGASRRRWRDFFARVPAFRCSDPYVEHCYWHRWSCLELLAVGALGVCEGSGSLHRLTSDATACHARELRWLHDPDVARQAMRTALDHVRSDGKIPWHLRTGAEANEERWAVSDWGDALLALDTVHPDDAFLKDVYVTLARHARWIIAERMNATGLVEVARGEVAFDDADRWGNSSRLCGVDAAVSAYGLLVALGRLATRSRSGGEAREWDEAAARLAHAVRERMWDAEWSLFRDVHPGTGNRVGPRSAVCFYPYRTDLADARHLAGLEESLFDPQAFWSNFPVTTAPANDERFTRDGARDGVRGEAPFRGPVVPLVNSYIIDGLGRVARAYAPHLRPHVTHLIRRTIRMFFDGADPSRIATHDYYDPVDGRPSVHRASSDSTRSWIIDAILQYVVGIRPHDAGIAIDPIPFGMEMVELTGVRIRGRMLDVRIEGERVTASIDGVRREGRVGTPMEIAI